LDLSLLLFDLVFSITLIKYFVMNPKTWTQKQGFLFNLNEHILLIPIVLKFDRC
jgi:hypothetical protein